jgi:WhiB family redox-sensing transcriptional regulator
VNVFVGAERGACLGENPDIFFSEATVAEARSICAVCEVRDACLAFALKREQAGVWGGLTEKERRRMRRRVSAERRAS